MHRLARLSAAERDALVDDFLDSAFGDRDAEPLSRVLHRSMTPGLPDDPTSEQLEAWVELAELAEDPEFRTLMRGLFTGYSAPEAAPPRKDIVVLVAEAVAPLLAAGATTGSAEAAQVVTRITAAYAAVQGKADNAALRESLAAYLSAARDPRLVRYSELLSIINGWNPPEYPSRELDWFLEAMTQTDRA
ncbi:hypothetical protein [Actinomadura latina]|uniref:Uncharacterized protein n=1 Tax=Actinomadura latina TaxID=163603 RepID=A0A846Z084_9ACTN|nr:hypothetical protein [Actinomadura latina]NKZ04195.1 hypothetical protein [Actinomadura latina]